ncbi:hypothetical protein PBI_KRATIO_8 [Mycobacterium phage Kratio]|uniref:Uncharacterized protein n=6 Tax=Kratiovirus TaxID=2948788 RepID=A0A221J744_9CAUD|nr:hypothetical protein CL76_gp93 [Mycobacterium phage Larva]YP_009212754.1 hypothetical protein PBI_KRATIO_8 [Mycobacterium phage Kratio]YP_009950998.1 hypothetical protein I5G76_gp92 [Mycobacterium phage Thyatira]AOQ28873.1 hypothetical protein SEA_WATERFOUL_9 [Mycobacterium phage Waterfoul]ASM62515.1 hypothetical protein SEA_ALLEYCAT_9 [Mycobacterium phage AlleyCat]ASR85706.1 hypothetical protein SEA_EDUGATOR_8 [Mycobacterium phage Edugator]QQV92614.1 hypothetical protein SEA_PSYCHO_9 [Myc
MTDIDAVIAARQEGRAAQPGDTNPYAGTGLLARMWLRGYRTMLLDRLNKSPARQAFLAAQAAEDTE